MALVLRRVQKRHDRKGFDCGSEDLNQFLRKSARQATDKGYSRTDVLVEEDGTEVHGYITTATASVAFDEVPPDAQKGLPRHPVPAVLVARLAISLSQQGKGLGGRLIVEAFRKAVAVSDSIGAALIVVDAKDDNAVAFYKRYGFVQCLTDTKRLVYPIRQARRELEAEGIKP